MKEITLTPSAEKEQTRIGIAKEKIVLPPDFNTDFDNLDEEIAKEFAEEEQKNNSNFDN